MKPADTKVVLNRRSGCSCDGSDDYRSEQFSSVFIALKIVACIVIILSIIEFGVGGAASSIVVDTLTAAWWGGLLSIIAGILALVAYNRGFVIAAIVISSLAIVVAMSGALNDRAARSYFGDVSACSSISNAGATPVSYGSEGSYKYSQKCLSSAGTSAVPDVCYCSASSSISYLYYSYCREYTLASSAKTSGYNCGSLFTTYPNLLSASMTINSIITISAFILSIVSCVIACKPRDAYGSNETPFVGVASGDP
jgi:hypothetical protein